MNTTRTRSRFAILHFAALALALIGATAYAAPAPPAPPTGTPPAATAPAPVTPPAPAPPTAPGARREETEGQEQPPAPGATAGLFDRALAFMNTKDGLASKIAGLEAENKRLLGELEKANGTISAQNTELADLRAGKGKIEAALGKLEGEKTTVSGTVAALGFQAQTLPPQTPIEASGDTEEEVLAQFRAETDATKKSALAAKLRAIRAKA